MNTIRHLILSIITAAAGVLPASAQWLFEFEAENMDLPDAEVSMWTVESRGPASGGYWLAKAGGPGAIEPATYSLEIPEGGTWYLWVRYSIRGVRAKPFSVMIQGNDLLFAEVPFGTNPDERPETYGDREPAAGNSNLLWTRRKVELEAGPAEIELRPAQERVGKTLLQGKYVGTHPPRVDHFFLTDDETFEPFP